jgi:hypothetical protein
VPFRKRVFWIVTFVLCSLGPAGAGEATFSKLDGTRLDHVYVRDGVDLTAYHALLLDAISVWYPTVSAPADTDSDVARVNLERAQELFRDAIVDAVGASFAIVERPGAGVLRVHAEFIDLRSIGPDEPLPADLARYSFRTKPGHVTMVGTLYDSLSGEELVRAADLSPRGSRGDTLDVDWARVDADLRVWAGIFADWLTAVGAHDARISR